MAAFFVVVIPWNTKTWELVIDTPKSIPDWNVQKKKSQPIQMGTWKNRSILWLVKLIWVWCYFMQAMTTISYMRWLRFVRFEDIHYSWLPGYFFLLSVMYFNFSWLVKLSLNFQKKKTHTESATASLKKKPDQRRK